MPFVRRDGLRLHWRSDGPADAPPLLLAHALGGDLAHWDGLVPRLTEYFRVVRWDCRGHGASDVPTTPASLDTLADDLLAVAEASGAAQFALAGVSMGGAVGLTLAARPATPVTRLLVSNSAAAFDRAALDARIRSVQMEGMAAVQEAVLARFFSAQSHARQPGVVASVAHTLAHQDPAGYVACCHAVRDADLAPQLAQIRIPTLVVTGTHDTSTPPALGEAIAAGIAGAQLCRLDTAHLGPLEQPSAWLDAAVPFLLGTPLPNVGALTMAAHPRRDETVAASFQRGLARRRATLGAAFVDARIARPNPLTAPFQQFITRYAWDEIWNRPALEPRVRRLQVLAITASLARWEEFEIHLRGALQSGVEVAEVRELLMQLAIYAGVPAAQTGFVRLQALLDTAPVDPRPAP